MHNDQERHEKVKNADKCQTITTQNAKILKKFKGNLIEIVNNENSKKVKQNDLINQITSIRKGRYEEKW